MPTMSPTRPSTDIEFARIVDELTRRGFLGGFAGSAALLGLTACGDSGSPRSSNTDSGTRRVPSVHGSIAVPLNPERVVTTDTFSMAAMFDLGIDPVGVYSAGAEFVAPQFVDRWRHIAKISGGTVGGAIQVEKVAALHPDLILGIDAQKPPYTELKGIAPTVILPFTASKTPWRDMSKDTATALGRTTAFSALQHRFAARAAAIRKTYADVLADTRWDVVQGGFARGQYSLYGPASPIAAILAEAGMRFASASASVTNAAAQSSVSYEEIGKLADADAIFYYTTNTGAPANFGPQLFEQRAFTLLRAARKKQLFGSTYFLPTGYSDAIGALDSLGTALEKLQKSAG